MHKRTGQQTGLPTQRSWRALHFLPWLALSFSISVSLSFWSTPCAADQSAGKSRKFRLRYAGSITGDANAKLRVWIPVPQSDVAQEVRQIGAKFPVAVQMGKESRYGNQMAYFETMLDQDSIKFHLDYEITRHEVRFQPKPPPADVQLSKTERQLFLRPNRNVPVTGQPLRLLPQIGVNTDVLASARLIYDRVDEHVRYDKSRPGYGEGNVLWVCDSGFGNCTDFHSLFISLARSQAIPARFQIGFPLPNERGAGTIGGYHCWAAFHEPQRGWIPVDISEADKHPELKEYYFGNLTENRVSFSIGRDIHLVPRQAGAPLNYFVYPYAEANGQAVTKNRIQLSVSYEDLE